MTEIDLSQPFYSYPIEKVVTSVKTDLAKGLSSDEAKARLAKYGGNELEKEEKESIWEKIKEQFEDNLVRILLLAAVISFVISQFEDHEEVHAVPPWVEPCVIFTILILNAGVGIWQDLDAERAIEVNKKYSQLKKIFLIFLFKSNIVIIHLETSSTFSHFFSLCFSQHILFKNFVFIYEFRNF